MSFVKEVYYDVIYKDITKKKPFPQIRSFKDRKKAEQFYSQFDLAKYDKYLLMYEKTILDCVLSQNTKNRIMEF